MFTSNKIVTQNKQISSDTKSNINFDIQVYISSLSIQFKINLLGS